MRQNIGFWCVKTRKMPCFGSCFALVLVVVFFFRGENTRALSLETSPSSLHRFQCTIEARKSIRGKSAKFSESRLHNWEIRSADCDVCSKKNQVPRREKAVGTLKNRYWRKCVLLPSWIFLEPPPRKRRYLPFLFFVEICNPLYATLRFVLIGWICGCPLHFASNFKF